VADRGTCGLDMTSGNLSVPANKSVCHSSRRHLAFSWIMFRTRFTPRAGVSAGTHGRRIALTVLLSTLVATASLTLAPVPRPAAADQIGDLKAQATVISQNLVHDQLQIDSYQQQYSVASEKLAADVEAIQQMGQQISYDEQQIDKQTLVVRQQAIRSYMSAGTEGSSSAAVLFTDNAETAQVADEYTAIATRNIQTAVDRLRLAQRALQVHQATLQQQQIRDQSDQAQQATALGGANMSEHQLESVQLQVTGQLAAAVTAQAAAQAAKAAAAVAVAQRAAVKGSVSATTSGSPTTSGSDPALNPFLQCVVQAESGGNYQAVSPDGLYMGAFQFSQATWNTAAQAAGLPNLVGVPPNLASKADQDAVAVALYALDGQQPWLGDRCGS
jgi:hypothetical protein